MALVLETDEVAARFSRRLRDLLRADEPNVITRMDSLCAAIGTDRSRVYAWIGGKSLPSLPAIRLVAEFYGVTTDDLLGVKDGD